MLFSQIAIFTISCLVIIIASKWVISSLGSITRSLRWKEFVIAFFAASVGAVLPELFIGAKSAFSGVPELAFGNVIGQNLILFTFSAGICAFVLKEIPVYSRTVRSGAVFALISVSLPFLLLYDGEISRVDGLVLVSAFILYTRWLFKDEDRFIKNSGEGDLSKKENPCFLKNMLIITAGFAVVLFAAEGIISSAGEFARLIGVPIGVVGIFFIGAGVALPETFFAIRLALKGHSWMILGGIMGAVSISSTLVLGIVALIEPIVITDFDPYRTARFFLLISAVLFWFFIKTKNVFTRKEAVFLFTVYLSFIIFEFGV
ncbi:MAG: sodium:calcium antiporter [Patescibacteria group bacterium]|nr:sodium:calcium antiporter [Patescibacteria group bacterium]